MRNRAGFVFGVLVAVALAGIGVPASAGDGPGPGCGPHFDMLSAALGLDEKQEAAVRDVLEGSRKEMMKAREGCRKKAEALSDATEKEIRGVLTDEQGKKFDRMAKKRGAGKDGRMRPGRGGECPKMREGGGPGGPDEMREGEGPGKGRPGMKVGKRGPRLERLARKLELSPEQKEQIGGILEGKRGALLKVRDECLPACRKVGEKANEAIRKLLNPEQLKIFDRIQAAREKHRAKGVKPGKE